MSGLRLGSHHLKVTDGLGLPQGFRVPRLLDRLLPPGSPKTVHHLPCDRLWRGRPGQGRFRRLVRKGASRRVWAQACRVAYRQVGCGRVVRTGVGGIGRVGRVGAGREARVALV